MPISDTANMLLSIGDRVPPGEYAMHSRFARVVNFTNEHALVSMVAPGVGKGPVNIVVDDVDLSASDQLTVAPDRVIFGRHRLAIDRRRTYRSRFPVNAAAARSIVKSLDEFTAALCCGAGTSSMAFLVEPNPSPYPEVLTAFERHLRGKLREAVDGLFSGQLLAGIGKLRGLGCGLTPSGDDFIAGLLAAIPVIEQLHHVRLDQLKQSIYDVAHGGNRLVNSFLEMARDGCYFARFRDVLLAMACGDIKRIRNKTQDLLAMGETSGCDMGVGFIMTVRQGGVLWR